MTLLITFFFSDSPKRRNLENPRRKMELMLTKYLFYKITLTRNAKGNISPISSKIKMETAGGDCFPKFIFNFEIKIS